MKFFVIIFLSILAYIAICYPIPSDTNTIIQVLNKNSYVIGYSTNHNQAMWCMYQLTKDQLLSTNQVHRTDDFREDKTLTNSIPIKPILYSRSGYDKGHLCPAQDRSYDINDMSETFLMSNMSPQDPGFNRGIWKKLEEYTRQCAIVNTNITVVCGPIIFNKHFNLSEISVPNMYYRIIFFNSNSNECYLIPNQKCTSTFKDYNINIKYIETISGFIFR